MGNFTDIEREFNGKLNQEILKILNNPQFQNNQQLINQKIEDQIDSILREMRFSKMQELCNVTNRNLICYISAWLQSPISNPELQINDNDMNGLMNAVSGITDRSKGLDILLHTPGGVVTATESIVGVIQ